ncbi:transcription factor S-II TFIIS [Nitzschia inconspicua]|uniref:Transcription factor S-II TFIIS n=1 Tax=Nitzschia inconspicua TaxID=303405 RepID=A0A9K3LKD6_9STRA|nr:transcription factor S-II TFIIS [Nitzschia inconspicua]
MPLVSATQPFAPVPVDAESYHAWAQSLVGRDWEIFWVEEEDNDGQTETAATIHSEESLQLNPVFPASGLLPEGQVVVGMNGNVQKDIFSTAAGQETAEERRVHLFELEASSGISTHAFKSNGTLDGDFGAPQAREHKTEFDKDVEPNQDEIKDDGEGDEEGSIIDDWYDGRILAVERTSPRGGAIESSYLFHIHFVGDETIYKLCLVPNKVRPSAKGWVQRTVALLRPPYPAGKREDHDNSLSWEINLPPDTRRLDDEESLKELEISLYGGMGRDHSEVKSSRCENEANDLMPPRLEDLHGMQRLRFLLEAQIFLRGKLAKIENPHGEDRFTDGVRNPTEPYVNHLVQCCRDLIQSCIWYCNSWRLLNHFFGSSAEPEFESLTFDGLVRDFMDFGRDTLVNTMLIDVDSCTSPAKRRQALSSHSTSSIRRTKRRRIQTAQTYSSQTDDDESEGLLSIASHLERDILSTNLANAFSNALLGGGQCWYRSKLGDMFRGLSHFVLNPLALWKSQAALLVGSTEHSSLVESLDAKKMLKKDKLNLSESRASTSEGGEKDVQTCFGEDDDHSSSGESTVTMFSYEDVQNCISAIRGNKVLSRFNLNEETRKLNALLHDIEQLEDEARTLFTRLGEQTTNPDQSKDTVLLGLKAILDKVNSPDSPLSDIERICRKSSGDVSIITRHDLHDAIKLREWFLNLFRLEYTRERYSLLQTSLEVMETDFFRNLDHSSCLARNRELSLYWESAAMRVKDLHTRVHNYAGLANQCERNLPVPSLKDSTDLMPQLEELHAILSKLEKSPVIFTVEEKIACRLDLIDWAQKCRAMGSKLHSLEQKSISFEEVRSLHDSLLSLMQGKSYSRTKLVQDAMQNDNVDNEIRSFVLEDIHRICEEEATTVQQLFENSRSWKERAQAVLSCLCDHGNPCAGQHTSSQKSPPMVDIKRINDLINEYRESRVEIPGYINKLNDVYSQVCEWSEKLKQTLLKDDLSLHDALTFVEFERDARPKGVIMNPNRSVVDSIVDLLSWYRDVSKVFEEMRDKLCFVALEDASNSASLLSSWMIEKVYPLLADGSEVLEAYCGSSTDMASRFQGEAEQILEILEKKFNLRKSSRAISQEKIQSSSLLPPLISRMLSHDESRNCPLRTLVWCQWHLLVTKFVEFFDSNETSGLQNMRIPSLSDAKELLALEPIPFPESCLNQMSIAYFLTRIKSVELIKLERIIDDAENIEGLVKELLTKSKELLTASYHKVEAIRTHISQLKEYHGTVRARSLGTDGLSLNVLLESQLEQQIKIFGWLLRTFQYPILHGETNVYLNGGESNTESYDMRIPWDALVGLYDKIPRDVDGTGDFTRCIKAVTELFSSASTWNNEITQSTLLSNRGNKRRLASDCADATLEGSVGDTSAKIQITQMELLANDPILSKVCMPRQKALDVMIRNSRQFEMQLKRFLAQDYHNADQDKAPFPLGDSLVGNNGQFILYRLTLSPIFGIMQSSMKELSQIGENVFAETPGKAAFDWMASAVSWIESLHYAVVPDTQFRHSKRKMLAILPKEARRLCLLGEDIFLVIDDDMRQTLSNHGIYISTSAQKKKLTVTLKKDGAHYSVGGTVIRWCPILFDALRADSARAESWEAIARKLLKDFACFYSGNKSYDEHFLFLIFQFREKVRKAFDEAERSLVVLPNKELLDSFSSMLGEVEGLLDKHSSGTLNEAFSKQFYTNSTAVHGDRFNILDTVLYRRTTALPDGVDFEPNIPFDCEKNFRITCIGNLEAALVKALDQLPLDLDYRNDKDSLCALKAWEIENEMFDRFQSGIGTSLVSTEYREKAMSLKTNLTPKNLSLCLRILTGQVDAITLVRMSSGELASQRAKLDREKAKREAMRDTVLTPGVEEMPSRAVEFIKRKSEKSNPPTVDKKSPDSILKDARQSLASVKDTVKKTDNIEKDHIRRDGGDDDDAYGAPAMDNDLPEDDGIPTLDTIAMNCNVQLHAKTFPAISNLKHSPPPPPPSLATGKVFQSGSGNEDTSMRRELRVQNLSGSDKFRIEIQGTTNLVFHAVFFQDNSSLKNLSPFLPETLIQKGRSKIDDFKRFLADKLKGGKWQATCLRLATVSGGDASVYKTYYKEYEVKERIAMFKLSDARGGNLFLVTPKFHARICGTGLVSFPNHSSTYGVALTKAE